MTLMAVWTVFVSCVYSAWAEVTPVTSQLKKDRKDRRIVGVIQASPAQVWGWTRRPPRRHSCGTDSRRSPAGEAPCPAASVCSTALQTCGRTTEPTPSSASRSLKHNEGEKAERRVFEDESRSASGELWLTVAEQPDDFGHVRVVFIVSLDEDVLAGVDDHGPRETLHTDGQRAGAQREQEANAGISQ